MTTLPDRWIVRRDGQERFARGDVVRREEFGRAGMNPNVLCIGSLGLNKRRGRGEGVRVSACGDTRRGSGEGMFRRLSCTVRGASSSSGRFAGRERAS